MLYELQKVLGIHDVIVKFLLVERQDPTKIGHAALAQRVLVLDSRFQSLRHASWTAYSDALACFRSAVRFSPSDAARLLRIAVFVAIVGSPRQCIAFFATDHCCCCFRGCLSFTQQSLSDQALYSCSVSGFDFSTSRTSRQSGRTPRLSS